MEGIEKPETNSVESERQQNYSYSTRSHPGPETPRTQNGSSSTPRAPGYSTRAHPEQNKGGVASQTSGPLIQAAAPTVVISVPSTASFVEIKGTVAGN